ANVGSVATEVGNPQNAYIAIRSGIPFLTFTVYLLPVTIVCLAIAIAGVRLAFRRDLAAPIAGEVAAPIVPLQRRGLTLTFGVAVVVAAAFLASPHPAWLPLIALIGCSVALFFFPFVSTVTPRSFIAKFDWVIFLIFVCLFLLLSGVRASGI